MIFAEQYGAVGVILFNDPAENVDLANHEPTYNDTFPNSWYLPPSGVERGSIMEFSGDPLTPGFPAKGKVVPLRLQSLTHFLWVANVAPCLP